MNNVCLIGRLTKDVEERRTQNGTPVAMFTLAVDRKKREDGADFINCVVWDKAAETIAQYVHKGDRFGVVGRLSTRSYDGKDGKKVFVTEVVVSNFQFLESKRKSEEKPSVTPYEDYLNEKPPYTPHMPIEDERLPF